MKRILVALIVLCLVSLTAHAGSFEGRLRIWRGPLLSTYTTTGSTLIDMNGTTFVGGLVSEHHALDTRIFYDGFDAKDHPGPYAYTIIRASGGPVYVHGEHCLALFVTGPDPLYVDLTCP